MEAYLEIAKDVAIKVKKKLINKNSNNLNVLNNKDKDIKLSADILSHNYIVDELTKTNIPVFSEEGNNNTFNLNNYQWIVDPLDGTLNYSRGFKISAISISLWDNGKPLLGVIVPLFYDDIYYSLKGFGAWKNNKKINVSKIKSKEEAILATGFPSGRNYDEESLMKTLKNIREFKKVRMIGSAVTMLSLVANGVFDIYEEEDIYIWDVAAGLSLVEEAGGCFSIIEASNHFKYNVKASNKFLSNEKI